MFLNDIPDDWSDQQALAVYEFLGTLRQRIRERYHPRLFEPLRSDLEGFEDDQLDLFNPHDDTPPF